MCRGFGRDWSQKGSKRTSPIRRHDRAGGGRDRGASWRPGATGQDLAMTTLLLGPADEVATARPAADARDRAVPAAAGRRGLPAHAAPRRRLGLRQRGRRGRDGRARWPTGSPSPRCSGTRSGVPVPHTAIIPTRKDALGQSLQEFVERPLPDRRRRPRPGGLGRRGAARRPAGWRTRATAPGSWPRWRPRPRRALRVLHQDEVRSLVRGVDAAAARRGTAQRRSAGRLLGEIVRDGAHHGLVDLAARRGPRVAVGQPADGRPGDGRPGAVVVTAVAGRQGDRPRPPRGRRAGWPTSGTTPATRPARPWTTC